MKERMEGREREHEVKRRRKLGKVLSCGKKSTQRENIS